MNTTELSEEISPAQLDSLDADHYLLIDTRTQEEYEHGFIPGCIRLSSEQVLEMARSYCARMNEKAPDVRVAGKTPDVLSGGNDMGTTPVVFPGGSGEGKTFAFEEVERIVVYCRYGAVSRALADELRSMGLPAQNLSGGYGAWALHAIRSQAENENKRLEIEQGIQKGAFHRDLLNPFARAILKYEMIRDGDRIAVCVSGGKDSMLMAKLFQEFRRHGQFHFDLTFLCMDPGYSEANRRIIESNASLLGIPLEFFETDIFDTVYNIPSSPCYLCARMRRGWLYKEAKARGCNKIALGHHYDDVIETVFMGMLYSGQWAAMMPKLRSRNFEDMQLIRPMYFIREDDIKRWRDVNRLHFIQCACRFTDTCTTCAVTGSPGQPGGEASADGSRPGNTPSARALPGRGDAVPPSPGCTPSAGNDGHGREHSGHKRTETKRLIAELKKTNPDIETNLFHATENVQMDKLLGYVKDGQRHTFLEDF